MSSTNPSNSSTPSPQLDDNTGTPTSEPPRMMQTTATEPPGLIPAEIVQQILESVVLLRVAEDYREAAGEIIHRFGPDKNIAGIALGIFKNNHTLRLEAKKLDYMQHFSAANDLMLMGTTAVALPFNHKQLERVTVVMHGGSLSSCDRATFKLLREFVPNLVNYFPSLKVVKLEITWDVDEDQERFGPHYIHLFDTGELKADALPLIDVRGAQQTCREWFYLLWQLYEFRFKNAYEIEVFSMQRSCVFNGKWEHDLEAAGFLFPNSNAWNPAGFQVWMSEDTVTHYQINNVLMECEPIAVEVVTRGADVDPALSDGYSALSLAKSLTWVKRYPAIVAGQKAADEREKAEREAMA